jgi:hypothetical protein
MLDGCCGIRVAAWAAGSRWGREDSKLPAYGPVVTVAASTFALLLNAAVGGGAVLLALGLKNVAF